RPRGRTALRVPPTIRLGQRKLWVNLRPSGADMRRPIYIAVTIRPHRRRLAIGCEHMRPFARFPLAILVAMLLPGRVVFAQPAELLPSAHVAYEDLEALAARGALGPFPIHTRPLARVDVARALIQARDRDPGLA